MWVEWYFSQEGRSITRIQNARIQNARIQNARIQNARIQNARIQEIIHVGPGIAKLSVFALLNWNEHEEFPTRHVGIFESCILECPAGPKARDFTRFGISRWLILGNDKARTRPGST